MAGAQVQLQWPRLNTGVTSPSMMIQYDGMTFESMLTVMACRICACKSMQEILALARKHRC
jgi:hypothetical protein